MPVPLTTAFLTELRESVACAADGFGGSDGFGVVKSNVERAPEACRSVVLVVDRAECDAARAAGMRAVALPDATGWVDEDLEGVADAIVDDPETLRLDDLTTPGAFWLNPMQPQDAEGYRVDPRTGLRENWDGYAPDLWGVSELEEADRPAEGSASGAAPAEGSQESQEAMDEARAAAILRDLDGR